MPSVKAILSRLSLGSLAFQSTTSTSPQQALEPFSLNAVDSPAVLSFDSTLSPPSCPLNGPLSCHNTTAAKDDCCFVYPGGQLMLTQFWDTRPSIGPNDSWTLHGLWPDLCDGRYEQFCHYAAPMYSNVTSILLAHSQFSLLETMLKYWLPNRGTPESFWHHEWNKHGTCVNTLAPRCYDKAGEEGDGAGLKIEEYKEGQELVDYFQRAVTLFKQLDTFKALALADIHPSTSRTYTNREISDALYNLTGAPAVLGCNRGALNQAWYTFNVRGNLQSGAFVASEPAGSGMGTCPESGIHWWPKDN